MFTIFVFAALLAIAIAIWLVVQGQVSTIDSINSICCMIAFATFSLLALYAYHFKL